MKNSVIQRGCSTSTSALPTATFNSASGNGTKVMTCKTAFCNGASVLRKYTNGRQRTAQSLTTLLLNSPLTIFSHENYTQTHTQTQVCFQHRARSAASLHPGLHVGQILLLTMPLHRKYSYPVQHCANSCNSEKNFQTA